MQRSISNTFRLVLVYFYHKNRYTAVVPIVEKKKDYFNRQISVNIGFHSLSRLPVKLARLRRLKESVVKVTFMIQRE
jgi:hypothetical protein